METDLIEFDIDGGKILIEAESIPQLQQEEAVFVDGEEKEVKKALVRIDNALNPLKAVGVKIFETLSQADKAPKEVSIEMGVKFSAEAGIVISKASTEANIKLQLKWINE